jgi:cysteine desulfurase/selenocysteine lyase
MIDACQSVPHGATDVTALDVDFAVFSGHKMCGPTGIGVLWARRSLLEAMPPFLGGGSMITDVRLDGFDVAPVPNKFEAGTPPIAEAVGLGAAVDFLNSIGADAIHQHEQVLTRYAIERLTETLGDDITLHGPNATDLADQKGGVLSFTLHDVHPHDISQVLDQNGVCIRAGHHCAKPLMRRLGEPATARASFYVYSGRDDVDQLVEGLVQAQKLFG